MTPTGNDLAREAGARSDVYGFLARLFAGEPSRELIRELKTSPLADLLHELGIHLGDEFLRQDEEALAEDLAVEYARLFLGPGDHISPHESVHHRVEGGDWGLLWSGETAKVKRFIEAAGVDYAPDYRGIPDHISVELEFLQKLTAAEGAAWLEGSWEHVGDALRLEEKFHKDHLMQWAPRFCEQIIEGARLPFFREMAGLLKAFLAFDEEAIKTGLSLVEALKSNPRNGS
jgi:TorA maturation chaperone TorD